MFRIETKKHCKVSNNKNVRKEAYQHSQDF